jgi:hypothetical protein
MRVKIVRAKYDTFWYAEHIGESFEVEEEVDGDSYKVIDDEVGIVSFINKEDCEIIKEDMSEFVKPPLGVMPKYIYEEKRIQDICRALYEYSLYDAKNINTEWIVELLERLNYYKI